MVAVGPPVTARDGLAGIRHRAATRAKNAFTPGEVSVSSSASWRCGARSRLLAAVTMVGPVIAAVLAFFRDSASGIGRGGCAAGWETRVQRPRGPRRISATAAGVCEGRPPQFRRV